MVLALSWLLHFHIDYFGCILFCHVQCYRTGRHRFPLQHCTSHYCIAKEVIGELQRFCNSAYEARQFLRGSNYKALSPMIYNILKAYINPSSITYCLVAGWYHWMILQSWSCLIPHRSGTFPNCSACWRCRGYLNISGRVDTGYCKLDQDQTLIDILREWFPCFSGLVNGLSKIPECLVASIPRELLQHESVFFAPIHQWILGIMKPSIPNRASCIAPVFV